MLKHIKKRKTPCAGYPVDECLELLRAMSDRTRQEILAIFAARKEVRVNDIAEYFSLSRPTISHHLNLMKRAGLLNARKDGQEKYYSLNKPYVLKLMKAMLDCLKNGC